MATATISATRTIEVCDGVTLTPVPKEKGFDIRIGNGSPLNERTVMDKVMANPEARTEAEKIKGRRIMYISHDMNEERDACDVMLIRVRPLDL